jgi:membrane-bound lytic murein transglycosylase A
MQLTVIQPNKGVEAIRSMRLKNIFFASLFLLLLTGCEQPKAPKALEFLPQLFDQLPQWENDNHEQALEAFRKSCFTIKSDHKLYDVCDRALVANNAKEFFETNFIPHAIVYNNSDEGLLTGYYEPLLHGSRMQSKRYKYPIYERPKDLVTIELDKIYPELKNYRLRGMFSQGKIVPYYDRELIDHLHINAKPICWVDDEVMLYFLHVQGSGRVKLENGSFIYVGYHDQNGHRYRSIGKVLIDQGKISKEKMSLQAIIEWFEKNPDEVKKVLHTNPSYIFFQERDQSATGSMGVTLTPERSIAVDRTIIDLGFPVFLSSSDPFNQKKLERLVIAQDTGGAIKGAIRADFFWGFGQLAGKKAGMMKEKVKMWILLPK